MDPKTTTIQGDLSRSDVIQLVRFCEGRRVVEFGAGGSTLILARCCSELTSYETDKFWFDLTFNRLEQIPDKTCEPELYLAPAVPKEIPECDVLWIDGYTPFRAQWLRKFFHQAPLILVHDSRRESDAKTALDVVTENFEHTKSVQLHVGNSNIIAVERYLEPVIWDNWNRSEAEDNRVSPYVQEYVCHE